MVGFGQRPPGPGRPLMAGGYRAQVALQHAYVGKTRLRVVKRPQPGNPLGDHDTRHLKAGYPPKDCWHTGLGCCGDFRQWWPGSGCRALCHETGSEAFLLYPLTPVRLAPVRLAQGSMAKPFTSIRCCTTPMWGGATAMANWGAPCLVALVLGRVRNVTETSFSWRFYEALRGCSRP